jgi:hypothetical protein
LQHNNLFQTPGVYAAPVFGLKKFITDVWNWDCWLGANITSYSIWHLHSWGEIIKVNKNVLKCKLCYFFSKLGFLVIAISMFYESDNRNPEIKYRFTAC